MGHDLQVKNHCFFRGLIGRYCEDPREVLRRPRMGRLTQAPSIFSDSSLSLKPSLPSALEKPIKTAKLIVQSRKKGNHPVCHVGRRRKACIHAVQ